MPTAAAAGAGFEQPAVWAGFVAGGAGLGSRSAAARTMTRTEAARKAVAARWAGGGTLLRNAIDDRIGCSRESAGGSGAWVSSPLR